MGVVGWLVGWMVVYKEKNIIFFQAIKIEIV